MDALETTIAEMLGTPAADTPPPDLAKKILDALSRRQRRRRLTAIAAVVALLVATAPAALVLGHFGVVGKPVPPASSGPLPTGPVNPPLPPNPLVAPAPPEALNLLIDRRTARSLPVYLNSGGTALPLRVDALGPTGLLLGGTGYDGGDYRATDRRIWLGDPSRSTAVALTESVDAWAHAAGDHLVAWAQHRDDQHEYQLMCANTLGDRTPIQVTRNGIPKASNPIRMDHDVLVWTDLSLQSWVAQGCTATPRRLPIRGVVVGLAYPDAFILDPAAFVNSGEGGLHAVDLETMTVSAVDGVPDGLWLRGSTYFAASPELLAWVADGRLTVLDRRTGNVVPVNTTLPASIGYNGEIIDLTVGHRLVVYASRPADGSPTTNTALVYDASTGQQVILASEAFACGDLLTWREGVRYVVANVLAG